jgi:hypothetical protein
LSSNTQTGKADNKMLGSSTTRNLEKMHPPRTTPNEVAAMTASYRDSPSHSNSAGGASSRCDH